VATYPDHGSSGIELIKSADEALYRAKAARSSRVA
jgi:GGDEF domain-containing protein